MSSGKPKSILDDLEDENPEEEARENAEREAERRKMMVRSISSPRLLFVLWGLIF
jgi:hypothetical protein